MNISNVIFGTTDADTELIRTPEIFDNAFFDPNQNINELINGYKFIVSGRKGDGKSAYLARLTRLAECDQELETIGIGLERLNSKFFEKFTDCDLNGGKRYVPMWKCIILLELVKYLEKRNFQIQNDNYCALVDALNDMGLLHGDSLETTITTLDSTEVTINVKNWVSYGRRIEHQRIIRGANDIYSVLLRELRSLYLSSFKFLMVFDGLDDILRNREIKIELITGLIRAANEINNSFNKTPIHFKVIVLIRNDILDLCRDPDISKIKVASLINLSWSPETDIYESNLSKLILARFNMSGYDADDFRIIWSQFFPETIDGRDSYEYMLENTLYKPRDVLMFFTIAQKAIGAQERKLSEIDVKRVLKTYSEDYFLAHMQDELTGFIPDDAINELQSVVSKIGSRRFSYEVFEEEMISHKEFEGVSAFEILKLMFERGYIGQFRKRPDHPKEEFIFQIHINPREKYERNDDCQIHRGLVRAFGI